MDWLLHIPFNSTMGYANWIGILVSFGILVGIFLTIAIWISNISDSKETGQSFFGDRPPRYIKYQVNFLKKILSNKTSIYGVLTRLFIVPLLYILLSITVYSTYLILSLIPFTIFFWLTPIVLGYGFITFSTAFLVYSFETTIWIFTGEKFDWTNTNSLFMKTFRQHSVNFGILPSSLGVKKS